jgi:hypothetical protein
MKTTLVGILAPPVSVTDSCRRSPPVLDALCDPPPPHQRRRRPLQHRRQLLSGRVQLSLLPPAFQRKRNKFKGRRGSAAGICRRRRRKRAGGATKRACFVQFFRTYNDNQELNGQSQVMDYCFGRLKRFSQCPSLYMRAGDFHTFLLPGFEHDEKKV